MMKCIQGSISRSLSGVYIKNGPNVITKHILNVHPSHSLHFLDEPGCIQKIEFNNGNATYHQKIIDVAPRPVKAFAGPYIPFNQSMLQNAGNTNIVVAPKSCREGNKMGYWALYDGGVPYMVDPDTLSTRELTHKRGFFNSHPKQGIHMMLEYTFSPAGFINTHITFSSEGDHDIKCSYPSFLYVHDFIVTDSYFIIFDHQLDVDMSMASMKGIGYRLKPKATGGYIVLIGRYNGGRCISRIPLHGHTGCRGVSTHHLGTKSDTQNHRLIIATISYNDMMNGKGQIVVYTICMKTKKVSDTKVINIWCEFPVAISPSKIIVSMIKPHTGLAVFNFTNLSLRPILQTRSTTQIYSEFAFDSHTSTGMCYIYDILKDRTILKLFEVQDEGSQSTVLVKGMAELEFPMRNVPLGLHGSFFRHPPSSTPSI